MQRHRLSHLQELGLDRVRRLGNGSVGVDPEEFSGFAFGLGIDRMCALMYELDDIRLLFENDVRFLEKFE
jgi:phenylalanyl-tRNA synthetase alpha subunit